MPTRIVPEYDAISRREFHAMCSQTERFRLWCGPCSSTAHAEAIRNRP